MKLFFETAVQARAFLTAVPLGLALGLLLGLERRLPGGRTLWDVLLVLLCAVGIGLLLFWTGESGLRAYHLLAVGTGLLLYRCGVGRALQKLEGIFRPKEKKTPPPEENQKM